VQRSNHPSIRGALVFALKVLVLRTKRGMVNLSNPIPFHPKAPYSPVGFTMEAAKIASPLWTAESLVEQSLQLGKVQNLRIAAAWLNRVVIPGREVFSFWGQIGRASRGKGFVEGRELREGCMIPAIGGGLCQLSNALYGAALESGCEIIERHAHSRIIPGSAAESGKDATVAWNYIDLRFRTPQDICIDAHLTASDLVLRFLARSKSFRVPTVSSTAQLRVLLNMHQHTCTDCDAQSCFRHRSRPPLDCTESAYLLDEPWPEFIGYAERHSSTKDRIAVPLTRARYAAFGVFRKKELVRATVPTVRRGLAMRHSKTVPARIRQQLEYSGEIARRYAKKIPHETRHWVVAQSLLPFLWESGALGGRSFDVLMSRPSLADLHHTLDLASQKWPERKTLAEYRAPAWMVAAEREALGAATKIITPHSWLGHLYADRLVKLDWQLPAVTAQTRREWIIFPGPTAARKGAFEVRHVLQDTGLTLLTLGAELEGPDFWSGLAVKTSQHPNWTENAAVVVQPALVEDNPRPLLQAISAGVPVICTEPCGVAGLPGVQIVEFGQPAALKKALLTALQSKA